VKDFDIRSFYYINSILINAYKYSLQDLEGMYPWEREVYIDLFNDYIHKLNEDQAEANKNRNG